MPEATVPTLQRVRRAARAAAFFVATLLAVPLGTGCLYWLRALVTAVPSPSGEEALVLDTLAAHNRVPLLVYLLVFSAVFALVGLVARWARVDRLTAALVMAVTTGLVTFVIDGISIYVVRQVSYGQAFAQSSHVQAVYLNAIAAGVAGALLARRRSARSGPARLFALAVGLAGLMELAQAVVPRFANQLAGLDGFAPTPAPPVANALVVPLGVVLLLSARALGRGSRRAFLVAVAVLAVSSGLHLADSYDYTTAVVCGILLLGLLARRREFTSEGAPGSRLLALVRLSTVVSVAYVYAFLALLVDRAALGLPARPRQAADFAARALVGLPAHLSRFAGTGDDWYYWSVASIVAIGVGWAVASWLAPWSHLLLRSEARRARVARIVRRYGSDTLSPFALRADKAYFFFPAPEPDDESAEAVVAYRVIRGVALVSGDPIGPEEAIEPAFVSFLEHARERGWKIGVLGASARWLPMYRRAGLRFVYHGDEAQVLTDGFELDTPGMKTVRQGVHRVERAGYRAEILYAGDVSSSLMAELYEVERIWLNGAKRTGFVMELDELSRLGGKDALFVVARAPGGEVGGFLHAALCPANRALSLSCLPRRRDTPNGLAAFVVVRTIEWARENGFELLSLNFAPFAGLLSSEEDLSALQRIEREALLALKRRLSLQLDNLMRFNQRFGPRLQPRYVVFERRADLPRVALAAMAAEGYLPFSEVARGKLWRMSLPHPSERADSERKAEQPAARGAGTGSAESSETGAKATLL